MLLQTKHTPPRNSDTAILLPYLGSWLEMYFKLFMTTYVVAN